MEISLRAQDVLTVVKAQGTSVLHLAVERWYEVPDSETLCGLRVRPTSAHQRFRAMGCSTCAQRALDAGITYVQEHDQAAVNLSRFYTSANG